MQKQFDGPQITEDTHWRLVTEPKPLENITFKDGEDMQNFIAKLHELGDPDYVPTAIVRVDTRHTVEETLMLLPDTRLTPADIAPLVRAKLLKLGGNAPVGEEALEWAVKETMETLNELQQ